LTSEVRLQRFVSMVWKLVTTKSKQSHNRVAGKVTTESQAKSQQSRNRVANKVTTDSQQSPKQSHNRVYVINLICLFYWLWDHKDKAGQHGQCGFEQGTLAKGDGVFYIKYLVKERKRDIQETEHLLVELYVVAMCSF